jgi:nucleoid-associated protein EbfC
MFRELGQLAGLMGKLPKVREEMEKLQGRLAELTAEGVAGGGMVMVKVNGKFSIIGCTITDEALQDRELLEDLIVAAANQAIDKARQLVAVETSKMAADIGLPPGMNLPGIA